MIDRVHFLLVEAFMALRRNGWMTFAAVSTAAVALFLLGGLGYVYLRVLQSAESFSLKFEMRVFLKDGTTFDQIRQTATSIRRIDGVQSAVWIPKDKAWEKEQEKNPELTEGLENPLPDGFKVMLKDLSKTDAVEKEIRRLPHVLDTPEGVVYRGDEQLLMEEILTFCRWLGGVLGGLLLITAGILIYNAIRLTVVARRREIRIMQLVGASQFTVRTPFVIEGMVQGAIGGALSALLIMGAQSGLLSFISTMTFGKNFPPFPLWSAMAWLSLAGALFGFICSSLAVREPLKFRSGARI
jgi:cell division transport system permease protein